MSDDDPFMNEDMRKAMIAANCTPQHWQPAWERPNANTATLPEWDQLICVIFRRVCNAWRKSSKTYRMQAGGLSFCLGS